MKKGLLSLLAVVLTVVGCQNYDDQFAALTKDIAAINTTLAGLATVSADVSALKTTVSGIQSGVTANGAASSALSSALTAAQTDLDAIEAAVAGVASAADLTAVSTALTAVQADVKEILAANSVINQALTINSVATLEYAESLISTKTDSPSVIVNGNITITTSDAVFDAAQLARVNAVTNKIATALKDLTANNSAASTTAIEFGALTFVDQNISFTGAPSTPLLKTVTGNMVLAGYNGAVDYSGITNIGGNFELGGTNATSLNLAGVSITGNLSTTTSATAGVIYLPEATSVDVGTAAVIQAEANKATTIKLGNTGTLASLKIYGDAATRVDVSATKITGVLTTETATPTKIFMTSVAEVGGAITVDAVAEFHATALRDVGAASTIAAEVVDLTAYAGTDSGTMSLSGAHTAGLTLPAASASTNALTAAAAKIVSLKSGTAALLTIEACENLTLTNLAAVTDFITDAGFAALKTLTIEGVGVANPSDATQTNSVGVTVAAAALTDVTISGTVHDVAFNSAALLKNITLTGAIGDITVQSLPKLETLSIGTSHIEGASASTLVVASNPLLTSIKPTTMSEVKTIAIDGNVSLSEIDFSALTAIPDGTTATTVSVTLNRLAGTYTPYVAATETTAAVETIIKSDDVNSFKPYITSLAATGVNTVTFELDISGVTRTTDSAVVSLTAAILAEGATGHTIVGKLDTAAELALVTTE